MSIPKEVSDGIVVKKDGLYHYRWFGGQNIEKVDSLLDHLNKDLYFEDDITFEDFFKYVMNEYERASDIFHSHLGGYPLSLWLDEWKKEDPIEEENKDQQINYLEVEWVADYMEKNPEFGIDEWICFDGKGLTRDKDAYGDDEWHETGYSFSFTELNKHKHYPFKINTEWKLYNVDSDPKDEDSWYVFKGKKNMTVYDVVGAILFEISFYGSPEERDKQGVKLKEEIDKIEKDIEDGNVDFIEGEDIDNFLKEL